MNLRRGAPGAIYMAFTVLSEAFLLMGFVLLAAGDPAAAFGSAT